VWILGEFGELIDESPYIIEKMIEEQKEFNSVKLSAVLLTTLFKLFFKRAPEVQKMLGGFLEQLVKTAVDTDLKQRAVFYYRLLKTDLALAQKVVTGDQLKVSEFFEDRNDEIRERLFLEFNSLSVVYQRPSERFLKEGILKQSQSLEKKYYAERWTKKGIGKSTVRDEEEEEGKAPISSGIDLSRPPAATPINPQVQTSLDELLDFGGGSTNPTTTTSLTT
jgi:hypothetical protein